MKQMSVNQAVSNFRRKLRPLVVVSADLKSLHDTIAFQMPLEDRIEMFLDDFRTIALEDVQKASQLIPIMREILADDCRLIERRM